MVAIVDDDDLNAKRATGSAEKRLACRRKAFGVGGRIPEIWPTNAKLDF